MKTKKLLYNLMIVSSLCFIHVTASAQTWVLDTIIASGANTSGIAITPDDSKIVVTNNRNPGKVRIISTLNYSADSIDVSSIENMPNGIAITSNGAMALVNTTHYTIFIDLSSKTLCGSYAAPCVGTTLYGIASLGNIAAYPDLSSGCTQQGVRTIIPSCSSSSSNFVLDNSGGQLYGIAIDNTGANAIVTGYSTHGPTNVNLSGSSVQNITGMTQSYGVATLHNSNEALVYDGDSIVRVSLTSNTLTKKITDLSYTTNFQNIAITGDDHYAFVVGAFDKKIIDLSNNTVIQTFTSGQTNIATKSDGSKFYVTDSYNGTVRVYKNNSVGMPEFKNKTLKVSVYPNPANDRLFIEANTTDKIVMELYDVNGQQIMSKIVNNKSAIDITNLNEGVYTLTIKTSGGVLNKKIVVVR